MKKHFLLFLFLFINIQNVFCQSSISRYFVSYEIQNKSPIVLYNDSTFFIVTNNWVSSGYYSLKNDTITLKPLKNDTNIKVVDIFSIKYKDDVFYSEGYKPYKDLSKVKLIINKDVLIPLTKNRKLFMTDFFLSGKKRKKIKINVNFILPELIAKSCNKSSIDTSDYFIIKQYYKNKTILNKTTDISKPLYVFDIDSSIIVISPKNMYLYFSPYKQYLSSSDSVISSSFMFIFKKAPLQYYEIGFRGFKIQTLYPNSPILDKLLKKKYTDDSYKKCTKQLMKSDYFHHKKVSFSDSLKINCNEDKFNFNSFLFGIGYVYLQELIEDYNISENYIKYKKNASIFVSKPAFTKNKLFALIKIKNIAENKEKYLLFERRLKKYQLIATINEYEIKLHNKSLVRFGQYYKSPN